MNIKPPQAGMKNQGYTGRLKKSEWVVRPVSIYTARQVVEKLHYSKGASNTAVYLHGLFRKDEAIMDEFCLGVAWWIPPTKSSAMATYPEGDWQRVLSLHRLAIDPEVPKNACSFLLARSIRMVEASKWECLVTYADTWQGHTGSIYKATNWDYIGLTKPSTVYLDAKDKMMSRKRGPKTYTKDQMKDMGFRDAGAHQKHKFRMILPKKVPILKSA